MAVVVLDVSYCIHETLFSVWYCWLIVLQKAKFSCVLFIFVGGLVFFFFIIHFRESFLDKILRVPSVKKVCFEVSSHNVLEELQ